MVTVNILAFLSGFIALLKVVHNSPPKKILTVSKRNFVTGNEASNGIACLQCSWPSDQESLPNIKHLLFPNLRLNYKK